MRTLPVACAISLVTSMLVPGSFANAAVANDNLASAVAVSVPGGLTSSNAVATVESGETTSCFENGLNRSYGATVWYKFTPPNDGRISITTVTNQPSPDTSGYFDTVMALYTGPSAANSFSALTFQTCSDDTNASSRSTIAYQRLYGGQTYYIQVGGFGGQQGTFQLQLSYARTLDGYPCSNNSVANWQSSVCRQYSGAGLQDDWQATWLSAPLNISEDAAHAGGFSARVLWFNDLDTLKWLEVGDTAGTGRIDAHQFSWERWWYWVDGTAPTYIEHGIAPSPNDNSSHTYFIQWDGAAAGWGIYICTPSVCTKEGSATWVPPTSIPHQSVATGLEVTGSAMNMNANAANVVVTRMNTRQVSDGLWYGLPGASAEINSGCGSPAIYPANYCLNGSFNAPTPPWDNWTHNKP